MTPAARLAAAMEILDEIVAGAPAERSLTRWARASRFAGSKDRAAIRDIVYDVLRTRRSALWCSGATVETGRALVIGYLARTGGLAGLDAPGDGHAPPPPDAAEIAALRDLSTAPEAVALDIPEALEAELRRSLDDALPGVMAALQSRAPVHLRVNTLRADRDTARAALAVERILTEPVPDVPTALGVTDNPRHVAGSQAFRKGLVELQDAASQQVAAALDARPGMTVLDLCAGGGGKTLALAAEMEGRGRLVAYDANPQRMADLPARAARAGARIEIADDAMLEGLAGGFDRVLVDAPCSGSGAWRRNPDHKWRVTATDVAALGRTQDSILDRAWHLVAPGGRILYATCSILRAENDDRVAAFAERHAQAVIGPPVRLLPGETGDGFYFCAIEKTRNRL